MRPAMSDPRWTIDEDGLLRCDGKFFGNYDVCGHRPGSYDALVAAVRDADLLRQARDFIALKLSDAWLDDEDVHDLLDLLSSPVADSREGTG